MQIPQRLFHYTVGLKLPQIQSDGYLKTTPTEPKLGERPVVWLSRNATYEHTARKHLMVPGSRETKLGSLQEMEEYCNGIYRFCFTSGSFPEDLAPLPWPVLKNKCRMRKNLVDRLVKRAKGVRAKPSEWYGTLGQLPIEIATLERLSLETGEWTEVPLSESASQTPRHATKQMLDNQVPRHLRARDEQWTD